MSNRAALRTRLVGLTWREESADDLTTSELNSTLQQAIDYIVGLRRWWWKDGTATTSTSVSSWALPSDFLAYDRLYYVYGNAPIDLSLVPYDRLKLTWNTSEVGPPTQYAERDDTIYFGPAPDQSYDFTLLYKKSFTVSDDTTTNHVTEHMEWALLCKAASLLGYGILKNPTMGQHWDGLYKDDIFRHELEDDTRREDQTARTVEPDLYHYNRAFNGAR